MTKIRENCCVIDYSKISGVFVKHSLKYGIMKFEEIIYNVFLISGVFKLAERIFLFQDTFPKICWDLFLVD